MSKLNRKFNNACQRASFWSGLELHFQGFNQLLRQPAALTSDDKQALKHVLPLLRECQDIAVDFRTHHENKLFQLRKEIFHE